MSPQVKQGKDVEQEQEVEEEQESQESNEKAEEALQERIAEIEADLADLGEAGGVAWTEIYGKFGNRVNVTGRGKSAASAIDNLVAGLKHAKRYGLEIDQTPAKSTGKASSQASGQSQSNSDSDIDGTNELIKLVILDDYVEFHLKGLKWPLKDYRLSKWDNGPQVMANLFDDELGFTEQHFLNAAIYTPEDWKNDSASGKLFVDWKKEDKYYNVKRVHS